MSRRHRSPDDPARRVAYDTLRTVDERDAYANLTLPALLRERGISGRDAAFATELAYGTLRGQGTYDAVLGACVDRPLADVDPEILDLLRMGTHQLLSSRVPDHAAVSSTVDLARVILGQGRAGFVNAVLRKVAGHDRDAWLQTLGATGDDDGTDDWALALRTSHPRWVVRAFQDALGGPRAETERLLEADNVPAEVTLVGRPGRCSVDELLRAGARPGRWSPYAAVLPSGDPGAIAAVREGRAGVQDEGSQLVTLALADAPVDGSDVRWLDLCAGPGGKAALLDALAVQRGARLTAVESQPHRADLVRRVVGGTAEVVTGDGTDDRWATGDYDRVLVDAPCTGLGALRRRPEARWRRLPSDVASLGRVQRALLANALAAVRPGGVVAYVTCSPHLAETRFVVDDVLRAHPHVQRIDARAVLPDVPQSGEGLHVQLWPHVHGTDAMYLALLRRADWGTAAMTPTLSQRRWTA
jgi:16S rRNA (cytosine967-C5)-methyltransferase